MRFELFLLSLLFAHNAVAQRDFVVTFSPEIAAQPLQLDQPQSDHSTSETVTIEQWRCYISDVRFLNNGVVIFAEPNSVHLLDAGSEESLKLGIQLPEEIAFDQISFNLGLDSTINVSGRLEGALDPTLGMYWTWQSGYIHFKLEGQSTADDGTIRDFSYHLGGYRSPYETCERVLLKCPESWDGNIVIVLDRFLAGMDVEGEPQVMSPGPKAKALMILAAKMFEAHD